MRAGSDDCPESFFNFACACSAAWQLMHAFLGQADRSHTCALMCGSDVWMARSWRCRNMASLSVGIEDQGHGRQKAGAAPPGGAAPALATASQGGAGSGDSRWRCPLSTHGACTPTTEGPPQEAPRRARAVLLRDPHVPDALPALPHRRATPIYTRISPIWGTAAASRPQSRLPAPSRPVMGTPCAVRRPCREAMASVRVGARAGSGAARARMVPALVLALAAFAALPPAAGANAPAQERVHAQAHTQTLATDAAGGAKAVKARSAAAAAAATAADGLDVLADHTGARGDSRGAGGSVATHESAGVLHASAMHSGHATHDPGSGLVSAHSAAGATAGVSAGAGAAALAAGARSAGAAVGAVKSSAAADAQAASSAAWGLDEPPREHLSLLEPPHTGDWVALSEQALETLGSATEVHVDGPDVLARMVVSFLGGSGARTRALMRAVSARLPALSTSAVPLADRAALEALRAEGLAVGATFVHHGSEAYSAPDELDSLGDAAEAREETAMIASFDPVWRLLRDPEMDSNALALMAEVGLSDLYDQGGGGPVANYLGAALAISNVVVLHVNYRNRLDTAALRVVFEQMRATSERVSQVQGVATTMQQQGQLMLVVEADEESVGTINVRSVYREVSQLMLEVSAVGGVEFPFWLTRIFVLHGQSVDSVGAKLTRFLKSTSEMVSTNAISAESVGRLLDVRSHAAQPVRPSSQTLAFCSDRLARLQGAEMDAFDSAVTYLHSKGNMHQSELEAYLRAVSQAGLAQFQALGEVYALLHDDAGDVTRRQYEGLRAQLDQKVMYASRDIALYMSADVHSFVQDIRNELMKALGTARSHVRKSDLQQRNGQCCAPGIAYAYNEFKGVTDELQSSAVQRIHTACTRHRGRCGGTVVAEDLERLVKAAEVEVDTIVQDNLRHNIASVLGDAEARLNEHVKAYVERAIDGDGTAKAPGLGELQAALVGIHKWNNLTPELEDEARTRVRRVTSSLATYIKVPDQWHEVLKEVEELKLAATAQLAEAGRHPSSHAKEQEAIAVHVVYSLREDVAEISETFDRIMEPMSLLTEVRDHVKSELQASLSTIEEEGREAVAKRVAEVQKEARIAGFKMLKQAARPVVDSSDPLSLGRAILLRGDMVREALAAALQSLNATALELGIPFDNTLFAREAERLQKEADDKFVVYSRGLTVSLAMLFVGTAYHCYTSLRSPPTLAAQRKHK